MTKGEMLDIAASWRRDAERELQHADRLDALGRTEEAAGMRNHAALCIKQAERTEADAEKLNT